MIKQTNILRSRELCIRTCHHLGSLVLLLSKQKLFGFPIFRLLAYTMKVIPEMRRVQ